MGHKNNKGLASKSRTAISVVLDNETISKIDKGPLASTGGKGKAAYIRGLIEADLENIKS